MEHELALALSRDAPPVMVEVHVMKAAQKDASIDVGATAFGVRVDVVRLAVGRGAIAAGDPAAAVSNS